MTRPSLRGPALRIRLWFTALVAALAAALVVACGGGGGVGTGGTGDVTSASGPITGFGSIFVAGIEFDDTNATVLDDAGAPVARDGDELRLGMTVHVEGVASGGSTAVAHTIRITTAVVGSADALDAAGLAVLGQRVRVNPATVFDPALPDGLGSLRPGDRVTVFGLPDPAGGHVATRIERAPAAAETRVKGTVSELDAAARTFRVGDALLSYAGITPPPGLANGQVVSARVRATSPGPLEVIAFDAGQPPPPEDSRAEIEGVVTDIPANRRFVVDGVTVDAQHARFDPNPAALAVGARVEVEGRMSGSLLVAEGVKVFAANEVESRPVTLNGAITAVDPAARTFVLRRTTVDYAGAQFVGGTAADLGARVAVRVEGRLSPDGTRLRATRIQIR